MIREQDGFTVGDSVIDGLICDLDGVVYRGNEPIEGSAEALGRLRQAGVKLLFCTNNSRSTIGQYRDKLSALGVEADPDDILTSGIVTAEVLQERGFAGKTAIVVGGDGLRGALSNVCISVKDDPEVSRADIVVVGWDPTFTYEAMRRAADAVRDGATFMATNGDPSFPAPKGLWPGAGAILASIEVASGRRAEVMGKPHAPMLDAAARRLADCTGIAMVGDRPETDLAGAPGRGWKTILVLSGVARAEDVPGLDPQPDLVVERLADLLSSG